MQPDANAAADSREDGTCPQELLSVNAAAGHDEAEPCACRRGALPASKGGVASLRRPSAQRQRRAACPASLFVRISLLHVLLCQLGLFCSPSL